MQGKEKNADVPGQEILEHIVRRLAGMSAFIAMRDNGNKLPVFNQ